VGVHHHLGFEQPERMGLGGLWSALAAPADGGGPSSAAAAEEERVHVARSTGARSPAVAAAVAALLRSRATVDAAA
jgi:hypothetical protein